MSGFEERKMDGELANDSRETTVTLSSRGDLVRIDVSTNSDPGAAGRFLGEILKANSGLCPGLQILLREDH